MTSFKARYYREKEHGNAYSGQVHTFKVAKDSTRSKIAKAVEALFPGVKVAKVNTVNCRGVMKRMGRNEGYTPDGRKLL